MELLIVDPFEATPNGYLTPFPQAPYSNYLYRLVAQGGISANLDGAYGVASGELSGKMLRLPYYSSNYYLSINSDKSQSEGMAVWGFAYKPGSISDSYVDGVLSLPLGPSDYQHLTISMGVLSLMGESAQAFSILDWAYIEVVVDLDLGEFEVYVDNLLSFGGTHNYSELRNEFRTSTVTAKNKNGANQFMDDIYHLGGTTGPFTDRLGPIKVLRAPLDSTKNADFTPTGAASNIDAVNKTSLSTASYNTSPLSNNKSDMYLLDTSDVDGDKEIIAVSQMIFNKKADFGKRKLEAVAKLGSDEVTQNLPENTGTFGGHPPMIIVEKPGGGAWTPEDLESTEFGYRVRA